MILNKVYNSLFSFNEKGQLVNEIVKDYSINENNLEIRIKIKNDFFFSTGKNLDSKDVVDSINLYLNKKTNYPYRANLNFIKRVIKTNKYEFTLKLKHKFSPWKNYLTFKILNSNEINKIKIQNYKTHLFSGTGYFTFKSINSPQKIILKKNPYAKSNIDKLIFKVILDVKTTPLKIISNEIDVAEVLKQDIKPFEKNKRIKLLKFNKFGYYFLVFNSNKDINYEIKKLIYNVLFNTDFLKKFLNNRGMIVKSPILLLNNSDKIKHIKEKPRKLKSKIRLSILTNNKSRLKRNFILFLCKELKKYNLYLNPIFFEYHKFIKTLKSSNFEIALSGFLLDIDYDINDILNSKSPFNYSRFSNKVFDDLLKSGTKEMNQEKRKKIYIKLHNLWLKELPIIPIFSLYYYLGINNKIRPTKFYSLVGSITDPLYKIHLWNIIN